MGEMASQDTVGALIHTIPGKSGPMEALHALVTHENINQDTVENLYIQLIVATPKSQVEEVFNGA